MVLRFYYRKLESTPYNSLLIFDNSDDSDDNDDSDDIDDADDADE